MKKLFENWRLFTEAKRGEPFNKFLVDTDVDWELPDWWEEVRREHGLEDRPKAPFIDPRGTDPEMEIPKATRRPSATPPPLPPEAAPIAPDITLPSFAN